MAKQQIIYVASLYHSGSTLLDGLLSRNPSAVGCGEVYKLYFDGPEKFCTCGKTARECELWSKVLSKNVSCLNDFYSELFGVVKNLYGNRLIVDSSKCHPLLYNSDVGFKSLSVLADRKDVDLKVIFLMREPRSWARAIVRRQSRIEKENKKISYLFRIRNILLIRYIQWMIGNKKILDFLTGKNISFCSITYEDLTTDVDSTLNKVDSFIGENQSTQNKSSNGVSHILVGNPSRFSFIKDPIVKYDVRWLGEVSIISDFLFFLILRICGKKLMKW